MADFIIIRNDGPKLVQQNRTNPSILISVFGEIGINRVAKEMLSLVDGDKVSFCVDPDSGFAYLTLDANQGFPGKMTKSGTFRFKNKRAAQRLLEALNAPANKSLLMYFTNDQPTPIPHEPGSAWQLVKANTEETIAPNAN